MNRLLAAVLAAPPTAAHLPAESEEDVVDLAGAEREAALRPGFDAHWDASFDAERS